MDSDDCFGMIQEQIGTTDKGLIRKIQSTISLWKNGLIMPEEAMTIAANEDEHRPRWSTATTSRRCMRTRRSTSTT